MKKYLIVIAVIFCSVSISAQKMVLIDSLHINTLMKQLPKLKGTKRVDCLNEIALEFIYQKNKNDSADKYGREAYNLSNALNYKFGLAMSLLKLKGTPKEKDERREQMKKIGEEINNDVVLGWVYYIDGKGADHFRKAGDVEDEAEVDTWLGSVLIYQGKYEEAFTYCERALILTKKKRTHLLGLQDVLIEASYNNIANLYKVAGDYKTALAYLHEARAYSLTHNDDWFIDRVIADLHNRNGNPDSAIYYSKLDKEVPPVLHALGEAYFLKGDFQRSLFFLNRAIDSIIMPRAKPFFKNANGALRGLTFSKAKNYVGLKDYKTALELIKKSEEYSAALIEGDVEFRMEKSKLYAELFHNLGNNDSAYKYLNQYTLLKDSIDNKKMLWRLSLKLNSMKTAAVEAKAKSDLALHQQKLKQQVFIRNSLAGGLLLLFLIAFFAFRNLRLKRKNERLRLQNDLELEKLQSEQKQTELQRQAVELEMQALRAQMNPHFIFNCLSSINRFIFKNDNKTASDYLTRFSRLIRMVLVNSQKKLITLEDELEMLHLYLDMERMRFKNGFDYSITTNNTIDAGAIFIPPLLLQPFCENAIWHGLMHKDGLGHLNISITEANRFLNCTITDNGIGREKAATYKSKSAEKQKSLGLKITSSRLALLNKEQNRETAYQIEDVLNEDGNTAGTKVQLNIFYKDVVEEIEENA
jgi:hypothetical protein